MEGRSGESPRPSASASPRLAMLHPALGRISRLARAIAAPLFYAALLAVAALRVLTLPASGSDIPQFAGFGETMLSSGPCFYVSASTPLGEEWPYPWLYPYGPLWALVLAGLASLVPGRPSWWWEGSVYVVRVPSDWVYAVKTVLNAADAAVAYLIYKIVGGGWRGRGGWAPQAAGLR